MARVLVTGATGCLGGQIVRDLLAQGHAVIAHGRDLAAARPLEGEGAEILLADLRKGLSPRDLRGVETIYHCAALSSAWGKPADFEAINVEATKALLAAAKAAGAARFIFASSPSIYATGQDRFALREDAPLPARMATAYARSKYSAECAVLAADRPGAMRTLALRPRAIYGRGDRALFPRLLAAIDNGRVPLISNGASLIDVTHVRDAAAAMIRAGQSRGLGGRAYNVSSGKAWRFDQLLDAVCAQRAANPRRIALGYGQAMAIARTLETLHKIIAPHREPVLTVQAVASLGRSLTLDITRAREELGYMPQVTLAEGIKDYADA